MSSKAKSSVKHLFSTEIINQAGEKNTLETIRLSENALTVLQARYLKKNDRGEAIETPHDMFLRVARVIADAEDLFGSGNMKERLGTLFYNMMVTGEFLPNSPTLMNAGRELGQLSACFVLPIEDSMESIFQSVKDAALIHKSGGGTGFSFSRLRPKNDVVQTTRGISSGPVSFMAVFDAATETIKQGGTRRGANMGILRVDHPDIREFITCKMDHSRFNNFNLSVAVTDAFMDAVKADGEYDLINPRTGVVVRKENARDIFNLIVENAHGSGEPGVIFIDRINENNKLSHLGAIESTNPCGEQPLLPYESCNLGSINLAAMVTDHEGQQVIDWEHLGRTAHLAVRFLDNVIEVNKYPIEKIAEETLKNRKIGLGVMGFADLLIKLGIPYDSEDGERIAEQVMEFINRESKEESRHLAAERGVFSTFEGSEYDRAGDPPLRNATTTTIAPTGTISIIASCSSGIEPLFAVAYKRNVLDNRELIEFHPIFRSMAEDIGIFNEKLTTAVTGSASLQNIDELPGEFKRVFRTAVDVPVDWHIRIQAAFQRHTDNAVSKTINFPQSATADEVATAYIRAFDAGLKGITIYRDQSRNEQVLTVREKEIVETSAGRNRIAPRPRPSVTTGATEKLQTGCGKLYVTVNSDEDGLCEVFCQMGRSGGCTASQSEAVSRLISLALRSGIGLDEIVSQLKGIRCPSPIWNNGKLILSCSDAIGTALSRYLNQGENGANNEQIPVFTQDADFVKLTSSLPSKKKPRGEMAGICPDCGGVLEHTEGCIVCRICGFSKCE
ncbi:MAG: vitamin B12-dependent ribonucleotide reductase [Candidatus Latescibacteria bacterium]|nr:vitamin B12-dependent ribonucleotide reductase [Candidatus Latescibacterota bacterium]